MKVLHINCNYMSTALHQTMIEHLDEVGCENSVFAPVYDYGRSVIVPRDNVVVSKCFKKWDRVCFDYKQNKIFKALEKEYNVAEYDCIHAYTVFTDGNCAMKLAEKYNKPFVVAVRSTDVYDFFRYMIHLRGRGVKILRKAKAVFFLSEAYREHVLQKYVPEQYREEIEEKSHIMPNGIHPFWFTEKETLTNHELPNGKEIRVVFAGQIIKRKNIPVIQKALELLRYEGYNATLTVVGKPVDIEEYNRIKRDPYTVHLPAMSKEELAHVYRQNDIFVMASFAETFGLVYAEAISQGLPVVYSRGEGFDNQFPEGTVGYRVDPFSAESVANAIKRIISEYDTLTQNIHIHAEKFSWKKIVSLYVKIYSQINNEY